METPTATIAMSEPEARTLFEKEFMPHLDAMYNFAFRLTNDEDDAHDLVQDTCVRAFRFIGSFEPGTYAKAWLFRILKNNFINDYRKKSKQATVFDNTPNDFLIDNNQTSVSNEAIAKLNLKEVQEAIHSLPIIFKNPFLLYFDGYKYHEIADMLNEPLGTIKSRIHFARKLLKNQLHRY